ncbi:hypothetical protein OFN55_42030, partial [Escherichia coli]|nr:hypothetical protein [Escherichia coli]
MMYMPRISPASAAFITSTTVRPGRSSSGCGACRGVGHALVVGQHHRDQARVRGTLHVVLAAQRVQAGARPADLPG